MEAPPNIKLEDLPAEIARKRAELEELETLYRLSQKWLSNSGGPERLTSEGTLSALGSMLDKNVAAKTFGATKKEQILNSAEFVLSDGHRRFSRALLREIKALGVLVGGENETAEAGNLAAYLSREKDRFHSDQKAGGWALKHPKTARPADVGASTGLGYIDLA